MHAQGELSFIDLIRLAWISGLDVCLSVVSDTRQGHIIQRGGEVIYAEVEGKGGALGRKAFNEIVSWDDILEVVVSQDVSPYDNNIDMATGNLLAVADNRARIKRLSQRPKQSEGPQQQRPVRKPDREGGSISALISKVPSQDDIDEEFRRLQAEAMANLARASEGDAAATDAAEATEHGDDEPSTRIMSLKTPAVPDPGRNGSGNGEGKPPNLVRLASEAPRRDKPAAAPKRRLSHIFQGLVTTLRTQLPGGWATAVFDMERQEVLALDTAIADADVQAMSHSHAQMWQRITSVMESFPPAIAGELQALVMTTNAVTFLLTADHPTGLALMAASDNNAGNLELLRMLSSSYLNKARLELRRTEAEAAKPPKKG